MSLPPLFNTEVPLVTPQMFYLIETTNGGAIIPPAMDQFPGLPEAQPNPGLFSQNNFDQFPIPQSFPELPPPTFSFPPEFDSNPFGLGDLSFIE